MMSSSSYYGPSYVPLYGKVGSKGGAGSWSSKLKNGKNEYLEVTFDREMMITEIETQGRYYIKQWVKSFILEYSKNGKTFYPYKVKRVVKVGHTFFD